MKPLAHDQAKPALSSLMALPNEAKDFAAGFTGSEPVQVELVFHFKLRVFERIDDAGVSRRAAPRDDAVALPVHSERLHSGTSRTGAAGRLRLGLRSRDSLRRPRTKRLDVCERPLELASVRILVSRTPHDPISMNQRGPSSQSAHALQ